MRHRNGWRWIPFYLRGPAWFGPLGCLLTFLGIWRFARRPLRIVDLSKENYCGCTIINTCPHLGSYGMGGPGFLGLKCRQEHKSFRIVFVLWAADGWLTLNGKLFEAGLLGEEKKEYKKRGIIPIETIHGGSVQSVEFAGDRATIKVQHADIMHVIELRRDGSAVPPWRGTEDKKVFGNDESLEDAIFVAPQTGRRNRQCDRSPENELGQNESDRAPI